MSLAAPRYHTLWPAAHREIPCVNTAENLVFCVFLQLKETDREIYARSLTRESVFCFQRILQIVRSCFSHTITDKKAQRFAKTAQRGDFNEILWLNLRVLVLCYKKGALGAFYFY